MNSSVLAVDVGATKAAIALVNDDLKIIERADVLTGNRTYIWDEISEVVIKLISSPPSGPCSTKTQQPLHCAMRPTREPRHPRIPGRS